MENYLKWQGEPVSVRYGYCHVKTNTEKPLMWYNYDCRMTGEAKIPAIEITSNDVFVISNQFGIGEEKLRKGGWPNMPHASLPDGTFTETGVAVEFDKEAYLANYAVSDLWMKNNYPEEYKKVQGLKDLILSRKTPK